jgi:hypothetical protein
VIPIATRTDTEKSAAAHKAAATRKENEAKRRRSARKAAETRARAQASRLKVVGDQAQRVADTALGGTVIAGEAVADSVRPLTSRQEAKRRFDRARRKASTEIRKLERRGGTVRRRTQRQITQRVRRNRREAERRVSDAQSTAGDAVNRVSEQARNLA